MISVRKALIALMFAVIVVGAVNTPSQAEHLCYTWDVRPVDEGGGAWNDRNYYLDVHGTTNPTGRILLQWGSFWMDMSLDPVSGFENGVRFGVHTWWAYAHFGAWKHYTYKYEYPC